MPRALTARILAAGLVAGLVAGCSTQRVPDEPPVRVDARAELNAADPVRLAQAHCAIAGKRAEPTSRADGATAFTCVE